MEQEFIFKKSGFELPALALKTGCVKIYYSQKTTILNLMSYTDCTLRSASVVGVPHVPRVLLSQGKYKRILSLFFRNMFV